MLNRLADRVRLRTGTDAPSPVQATRAMSPREFHIGDEVRARIAVLRPDGIASVTIEDQPFLLRLPFNARAGEWIRLTVSALEPRLKFELSEAPDAPSQPTRISDTARFITALLAESEKLATASTAVVNAPLVHGPPPDTTALASALADALAESGMFYESHQAQWVAGTRPLAALLNEPQARIPNTTPTPAAVVQDASGEPGQPLAAPASPLENMPVHRDALPIVRQQLETLETRHLLWHGLVWQDQTVTWRIEEPSADDDANASVEPLWRTHIALTLSRLGEISATAHLTHDTACIAIHAATPETAAVLAAHRATLHRLLYQAGLRNIHLTIDADEVR